MSETYAGIMSVSYSGIRFHNHMNMCNRAAQFAPFAALTGYDSMVKERSRQIERKHELSEDEAAQLNCRLNQLASLTGSGERPSVTAKYFQPDSLKEGGKYILKTGKVRRIDAQTQQIVFNDGDKIAFSALFEIRCSKKCSFDPGKDTANRNNEQNYSPNMQEK